MGIRLQGQRAVITGAAGGIGVALAETFTAEGARVVLFDMDEAAVQGVATDLQARGHEAHAVTGSVAENCDVARAFEAADKALGGIDILINNAGVGAIAPSLDLSDEAWDHAMSVNLRGTFLCSRAAGARMVAQGSGAIVNIASIYGLVAAPNRLAYCVSKSGVAMMAKVLASEWGPHGVRVNAIAPGYVRTASVDALAQAGSIDVERITQRTPLRRMAETSDVAEAAVHLCSSASAYITGQVIAVDGGWTAYGYV
jgi:NAD(P)-dependent dehydrogenase (short-subunit alcohol dehydrogenase family)